jgi:hypothetical protein
LACGACALLAKLLECRETIVDEEKLVTMLAQVLGGARPKQPPNAVEETRAVEEKKDEHGDVDDTVTHKSVRSEPTKDT